MDDFRHTLERIECHERLTKRLSPPRDHLLGAIVTGRDRLIPNQDIDLFAFGALMTQDRRNRLMIGVVDGAWVV